MLEEAVEFDHSLDVIKWGGHIDSSGSPPARNPPSPFFPSGSAPDVTTPPAGGSTAALTAEPVQAHVELKANQCYSIKS